MHKSGSTAVPIANNCSSVAVKKIAYCLKWFKESLNTCP